MREGKEDIETHSIAEKRTTMDTKREGFKKIDGEIMGNNNKTEYIQAEPKNKRFNL